MRRYEQIYILRPSLSEDEITAIIENTKQIITNDGGAVIFLNKWGMKKLAYQIKKEYQGYYVFCDFAGTPQAVAEIERKFRIDDAVLKYLTVKITDMISPEEIGIAQNDAAAAPVTSDDEDQESDEAQETDDSSDEQEDDDDEDEESN